MSEAAAPVTGQTIWCLGMYASASTWLFNVVRQVLQTAQQEKVQVAFVSGEEKALTLELPGTIMLVKSHEISRESYILEIAKHSRKILITIRDPRDAVASLMQSHGHEFSKSLDLVEQSARLCMSFAKDRRAKLFIYETVFFEDPATVGIIAGHLGYQLDNTAIRAIYESLTRSEVEKHIQKMPKIPGILKSRETGDLLDTTTQWHSHHAGRSGEIGKWKRLLTAQQAERIEQRMEFFAMTQVSKTSITGAR